MNAPTGAGDTATALPTREAEIHKAVEDALRDLEQHAGQEGYRHLFDKTLHVLVAIDQAGFRIVRKAPKR